MNMGKMLGGLVKGMKPLDFVKEAASEVTESVAEEAASEWLQKQKADEKAKLADELRECAGHVEAGRCDKASQIIGQVLDRVKF